MLASVEGMDRTAVKIEKINGIEHLCAWFTADHQVDIGELKKELGRTLTNYMVPTAYMQLEEMPITPNGKLDLKNLPVPELFRSGNKEAVATPAEKIFSEIFSSILHVDDIGATENFFDLGGTSLLVTNVVIEAGRRGLAIAFGDVFDNPTPRALAALASGTDTTEVDDTDREITDYDYSAIDELLAKNTVESFKTGECHELGNVLLTGAGGYLGIHVLRELIEHPEKVGRIYCMIRSQEGNPSEKRLSSLYFYYFDTNLIKLIGDRLFVIDADVTDRDSIGALEDRGIDTVINCAAVVKHFSSGTIIEDVNVGGAVNLVDFCVKTGARMIQTSTMSVIGQAYADEVDADFAPTEKTLYFNQLLDNKYIHSKFLSERAVLEAVATKGLKGKVMRFGNLAARDTDGEFQINFETNSAVGRLKAFVNLGCAAYDQLEGVMEFSPIDAVAQAVVLLAGTPDDCTMFHVCNNRTIFMESIFSELNNIGYNVDYVEREEFAKAFAKAQSDPEKASTLTSLMAYMQLPGGRRKKNYGKKCDQTMQILYRLGFSWPETTRDYIDRLVAALAGFGFFDV